MSHQWKPLRIRLTSVHKRTRGYLPQWRAAGSIYSVTARLADSLPATVRDRLDKQRRAALENERLAGALTAIRRSELAIEHILRTDAYLDRGYGSCKLRDPRVATMTLAAARHFDGKRLTLFAVCVMPNHLHLVLQPYESFSLSQIMHSIKSYTSNEMNRILGGAGRNWQIEPFDRIIRDAEDLQRSVRYMIENPVVAGLGEDWPWVWWRGLEARDTAG